MNHIVKNGLSDSGKFPGGIAQFLLGWPKNLTTQRTTQLTQLIHTMFGGIFRIDCAGAVEVAQKRNDLADLGYDRSQQLFGTQQNAMGSLIQIAKVRVVVGQTEKLVEEDGMRK